MFYEDLRNSGLTNNVANDVMGRISGPEIIGDLSMLATLRALVFPRLEENKTFNYEYRSIISKSEDTSYLNGTFDEKLNDRLLLYRIMYPSSDTKRIEEFDSYMAEHLTKGWEEETKIRKFCESWFKVRIYINEKNNAVHIYAFNLDKAKLHFLESVTPLWYPKFKEIKELTETERRLCKALSLKDGFEEFKNIIDEIANNLNLQEEWLATKIKELHRQVISNEIESREHQATSIRESIKEALQHYNDSVSELDEILTVIIGLKTRLANANDEKENTITEYLKTHPCVKLANVENGKMILEIYSYLSNWNQDSYKIVMRQQTANNFGIAKDNNIVKKILDKIFVSEEIKLKMCSNYCLGMDGSIWADSGYCYEKTGYMPNPHIRYHGCLGDYNRSIPAAMSQGNIEEALDGCIASTGSVNVEESITFRHVPQDIFGAFYNAKILVMNRTEYTPKEIYEMFVKEQEKENGKAD